MRRIWLAIRVLFLTLFRADVARQVEQYLLARAEGRSLTSPDLSPPAPRPKQAPAPRPPLRSEALTLLATLQREARFVDFTQEALDGFSDAQIGAAARDIHRDCAKVLERLFAVRPMVHESEGASVDVPSGFDAGRYHLTGNVTGVPPFRGQLVHHGWEATICELPSWTGSQGAARVVAPVEVELK